MIPVLMLVAAASQAAVPPRPPEWSAELAAMQALARRQGEALWPGFGTAPFGLLMLEPGGETLICHPVIPAGFAAPRRDAATGCERAIRPRGSLPDGLLAAMPIFGPPSTIVVGTPAATGTSLPRWRLSILHEHFHQWQDALPDLYARVAALDLAGGDESGMWMLNFPFPYARESTAAAHAAAARALAAALAARGTADFGARLEDYLRLRRAFAADAGERNWRYFEFQLWKEGVARWTEIGLGAAADDPALRAEAALREGEVMTALDRPDLAREGRLAVYAMGAGEAMVMEACGPRWRAAYPQRLALGPLLEEVARACAAR